MQLQLRLLVHPVFIRKMWRFCIWDPYPGLLKVNITSPFMTFYGDNWALGCTGIAQCAPFVSPTIIGSFLFYACHYAK
jgi:hypothetical protein